MITTHLHAISKKPHAYLGAVDGMEQFTDGKAIVSCPIGSGQMVMAAEHDRAAPAPPEVRCRYDFTGANHTKFDAMKFWPEGMPWKQPHQL